ncbi:MAG: Amidinotransferase [candidate division WS6 bacterium OLB20]|uniref:Amidinotransferase n=1 Tax=candidate division WS6 bacterium OLB20 TaxID=1617426 RepID=A0A136LY02_9BACT|nr:MAG: Amidinotransferase [candidate division WS6 bacterium OLB20]
MTPDGRHFMGYGKRTQKEAASYLSDILGSDVTPLELIDPYYYHLDTAFSPLTDDIALYNPRSFTEVGRQTLSDSFTTLIETSEEDNRYMAPNLLRHNNNLVMAEGISDSLKQTLAGHGFTVHTVATSEFLKGGGSIKCLSLQIH